MADQKFNKEKLVAFAGEHNGAHTECPETEPIEWLQAWTPSQFRTYEVPEDFVLIGDNHIQRGGITVLGGWPGVGKSRAAMAAGLAGATGKSWFGLPVHARFRTLIIQTENGEHRLKGEFDAIGDQPGVDLDEWIRVTPPPPFGLAFDSPEFCAAVSKLIDEFEPGLIVIDPWNAVAADDRIRDYRASLDALRACLPSDPSKRPAILVIHHMRKKSGNHVKKHGRDLLHELAGSYAIGATARCVYAMEPATSDSMDDRVIFTCCKCNDGPEGEPSAWHRRDGFFEPCLNFDWKAHLEGEEKPERGISKAVVKSTMGDAGHKRSELAAALEEKTSKGRTTCYNAIKKYEEEGFITEGSDGLQYWNDLN